MPTVCLRIVVVVEVFKVAEVTVSVIVIAVVVSHVPLLCGRDCNVQAITCISGTPRWWWRGV